MSVAVACLAITGWLFLTGVGLPPAPEELAVVAAGAFAHERGDVPLALGWLACVAGVFLADLALYAAGRFGGRRLARRFLSAERFDLLAARFRRHGLKFMLTGRLLPGVRTGVFVTAGVIHYPLRLFLLADLAALPVVAFFFGAGYFAKAWVERLIADMDQARYWLLLGALGLAVALIAVEYVRLLRRRAREEEADRRAEDDPPVVESLPEQQSAA